MSGTTEEKYCRLYKLRNPVESLVLEKTSPDSIGSSRVTTYSFVREFPRTIMLSTWLLSRSAMFKVNETVLFTGSLFIDGEKPFEV